MDKDERTVLHRVVRVTHPLLKTITHKAELVCTVLVCVWIYTYVSWCGGKSWVDQRVPRVYIHDVALLL